MNVCRHCDINEYKFTPVYRMWLQHRFIANVAYNSFQAFFKEINCSVLVLKFKYCVTTTRHCQQSDTHDLITADKIQVNSVSDMTLLCRVSRYGVCQRVQWQNCFGDKRSCPYGKPKCSKDSYLVVCNNFWLSWTTGQPLLRTLLH